MTPEPGPDAHPDEDELLALALGTLPGEPAGLLRHLTACAGCRSTYDELSAAVDSVLPAAPAVAPPAGFDARVLERLELPAPAGRAARRWYRMHRPLRVAVAAAVAVAGICLGAAGAVLLDREPPPAATVSVSDRGALLVTGSGATVGTVEPSRYGTEPVLVMQITDGRPGAHYTCRLVLTDGTTREAGQWRLPSSGRATWIAYRANDSVHRVELVTDAGSVWSSARLDG